MPRARNRDGTFTSGGEPEDFVAELAMERFWNALRIPVTFGADASQEVGVDFETGLDIEAAPDTGLYTGWKWVIKGGVVQPATHAAALALANAAANANALTFQIQEGKAPATPVILDRRDERVVAEAQAIWVKEAGSGTPVFGSAVFPFDVLDVKPMLRKYYHICAVAQNQAAVNSTAWLVTLQWGMAPLNPGDVAALMQSRLIQP